MTRLLNAFLFITLAFGFTLGAQAQDASVASNLSAPDRLIYMAGYADAMKHQQSATSTSTASAKDIPAASTQEKAQIVGMFANGSEVPSSPSAAASQPKKTPSAVKVAFRTIGVLFKNGYDGVKSAIDQARSKANSTTDASQETTVAKTE